MSTLRRATQTGFFALFIAAPPLDLLRIDLLAGHLILFGEPWHLGISADSSPAALALTIALYFLLPLLGFVVTGIVIAWRYGRLYCGWLCPHYSVVELINALLRRAIGRLSIWDRAPLPEQQCDGSAITPQPRFKLITVLVALSMAALWAVVLLTYLLPPSLIYANLLTLDFSANQWRFLAVATILFTIDFLLARHLFCRFGCAVGVAQSLIWMGNRRALVVGFDSRRAKLCQTCDNSCEHACPMRLKPRTIKRAMFTCTQCRRCIESCEKVQQQSGEASLLQWVTAADAEQVARLAPRLQPPPPHRQESNK
ncbi:4Fe-4S binding protein [Ectothiorhodospiraceae bacterium BW-2]|nr:4Fe-4S binding protein [Ectothiorhodospiraceae bacterium BW-2]